MKKIFSFGLFFVCTLNIAFAQIDMKAKKILDELSKKYKSYNIVSADFLFTIDNPQAKLKETKKGRLIVKSKTDLYKVIIDNREVFCDGNAVYSYTKDENEINIDNIDKTPKTVVPSKIFTLYENGFKYTLAGEETKQGELCTIVDLIPIDAKTTYFKIKLAINKKKLLVTDITVFDKNGTKYTYSIKKFDAKPKLDDKVFVFDANNYKGAEIIDLR